MQLPQLIAIHCSVSKKQRSCFNLKWIVLVRGGYSYKSDEDFQCEVSIWTQPPSVSIKSYSGMWFWWDRLEIHVGLLPHAWVSLLEAVPRVDWMLFCWSRTVYREYVTPSGSPPLTAKLVQTDSVALTTSRWLWLSGSRNKQPAPLRTTTSSSCCNFLSSQITPRTWHGKSGPRCSLAPT